MSLRAWVWLHKWSSLVSMVFLLMLCLTGLPLIFHEEIDHLFEEVELEDLAASSPLAMDQLIAIAKEQRPNELVHYVSWDAHEHPHQFFVTLAPSMTPAPNEYTVVTLDERSGKVLANEEIGQGFMALMLRLHTDMFLGLAGLLFLGLMGLLLVVAIISGIVLYRPFMKRLDFGTVRHEKGRRIWWLDSHNLLGVVSIVWVLVVGFTGSINTLGTVVIGIWQNDQLAALTAHKAQLPALTELGSLEAALNTAMITIPDKEVLFVAYPGTPYSSSRDYAFFLKGDTPLTARLLVPVLVDAQTAELTATAQLPWYVKTLLLSQPLHFGDYGGLPLKILWALFDLITIYVLWSGVVLWWQKRRQGTSTPVLEEAL